MTIDTSMAIASPPPIFHLVGVPFALLLIAIALLPLVIATGGKKTTARSASSSRHGRPLLPALAQSIGPWVHSMADYLSFIILLGSLYM